MKHPKTPDSALRRNFLRQLQKLRRAIKGSLAEIRKPCIRPNCPACARGDKHPAFILSLHGQKPPPLHVRARGVGSPVAASPHQRQGPGSLRQQAIAGDFGGGSLQRLQSSALFDPVLLPPPVARGPRFGQGVSRGRRGVAVCRPLRSAASGRHPTARPRVEAAALASEPWNSKWTSRPWFIPRRSILALRKSKTSSGRKQPASIIGRGRRPSPPTTTAPNVSCVHWSSPANTSFGSQSEQGARTREILMSVLLTLEQTNRRRLRSFQAHP